MRTLKTSEAAAVLNVSPSTLRAWERRFGYPRPQRSPGHHRAYIHAEVLALRDALQAGLSISSAVSRAREALSGDTSVLVAALGAFELERADTAMEAALALRSVERSVEEVLIPSLDEIALRHGTESAPWAVTATWADGWLRRAHRLAPSPSRPMTIVIGDATGDPLELDALALRAFELFCARSGACLLTLPVRRVAEVADVIARYRPQTIVVAGDDAPAEHVVPWVHQVRLTAGQLPLGLFRRESREGVRAVRLLPDAPYDAHRQAIATAESMLTGGQADAVRRAPPRFVSGARRSMA